MEFPITQIQNELIFVGEGESVFFELQGVDVEHLTDDSLAALYEGVKNSLNNLKNNDEGLSKLTLTKDSNHFYKFYSINGKTYISSDDDSFSFTSFKNAVVCDPITSLFGSDDFWGSIEFEKDHFVLNGSFWRFINLYEVPGKLNFLQLSPRCSGYSRKCDKLFLG